ncbi:MAG: alpha/beta hydrolase [Saprospiraceae bacterium]|nr:alpha/beta hydrolase [Saprospiraceae bacterium]MBK9222530.1 alpha/beta hydrolase [Saprospiraceae bacterium]
MVQWILSGFLMLLCTAYSFSQKPVVAFGKIIRHEKFKSTFVKARNIDVWLPPHYDTTKRYPVLYMQDGQMLFDSTNSWNHKEWKIDETLTELIDRLEIKACIVVGIWNDSKLRRTEYCPEKAIRYLPKALSTYFIKNRLENKLLGDDYLSFLVKELKPFIDQTYATLTKPENTFIAGSSMGALISLYAVCEYPDIFSSAICMSTHWPVGLENKNENIAPYILMYLKNKIPDSKTHRFYFDYGTLGSDLNYRVYQLQADQYFKENNYTEINYKSLIFKGDDHSENSWSNRFSIPIRFILKK